MITKTILAVLMAFVAGSAFAEEKTPSKCDCKKIAGLWVSINEEKHVGTFINIPKSCKGVKSQMIPAQPLDQGLDTDRIFCKNGKYRMQFRFPEGYVDDEGTKAVYPLPPEVAIHLQGDVRVHNAESISFGMDLFDKLCVKSSGKPCDNARFKRVPKDMLYEE